MYFPIKGTDLDRRIKLTKGQRAVIRYFYRKGVKIKELAEKFNVSYSTIYLTVCDKNKKQAILKSKNKYKLKWWGDMPKETKQELSHKYYTVHKAYKTSLYQTKQTFKIEGKDK